MQIGIHQPNFLPWMGYFYKIAQSDTFVFLDHVEYTKNSFTKRVKIHKPSDLLNDLYITVPLKKHSDHTIINALNIADDKKWQKKVAAQIYASYHKAPYFQQVEPLLNIFFKEHLKDNNFSAFNIEIIKYISDLLDITPKWILSSDLEIPYVGDDVNLDILDVLKGKTYLSGMGGKKYQDVKVFADRNVKLKYSDYPLLFEGLDIPNHFLNKSIVSYLAHYSLDDIKGFLHKNVTA